MSVDEIREKYLLEKGEAKGEERGEIKGRLEGIELTKKIFKLLNSGKNIEEISKECKMTIEEIKEIVE